MVLVELKCDDILIFAIGDKKNKCRVSKIDGNVVKLFEEDGTYRQMCYRDLKEMIEQGYVTVQKSAILSDD